MIKPLSTFKFIGFLLMGALLSSCLSSPTDDFAAKQLQNDKDIQSYISKNNLSMTKDLNGMYYNVTSNGGSRVPQANELVTLYYVTSRLDGTILDSTSESKQQPSAFIWTTNAATIFGLPISTMKQGDKGTFLLPSGLAYGSQSYANLPAYSPIRVDIKFLKTRNEEEQISEFLTNQKLPTPVLTSTGLRYIITKSNPAGDSIKTGKTVKVNYVGKLLYSFRQTNSSGLTTYDSQFDAGSYSFVMGAQSVIAGFQEGISKMRVGEKAILVFPSSLGYGASGGGSLIPPYAPLYFEIEVVSIQ
ncbi:FKBP-type peptidyl-prolyl cis-trans isomerase [Pseudarcicella hirudinis]|uniref:Peptidyl-prolyl cis-trans isomerase n=1 Tax=Pseudarcicella hirudinis TaxID=1079859 RepID=A0A1I5UF62_9BACT|nr:FKBP-type peptidyl-prolyl cis-trans isomerase [Pseudarcicella hirudinis]SFP93923.1 FKBP-type peptidyl-prolyl cis-trans isomerase [Pseudarcicella hirudinis]